MVITMPHPQREGLRMVGSPIKLSDTPVAYSLPPPLLGEHTVEVLQESLGYTTEKIIQLEEQGVIRTLKKSEWVYKTEGKKNIYWTGHVAEQQNKIYWILDQ